MQTQDFTFWSGYAAYREFCQARKLVAYDANFARSDFRTMLYLRDSDKCFAELEKSSDGTWEIDLRTNCGIQHDSVAMREYLERNSIDL